MKKYVNAIVWLYCRTMNSITPEEFVRFAHPYIMPEWCQEEYAACIEQNRPYKYVVEYYPIRFYTVQDKHGNDRKIWLYRNCAVGLNPHWIRTQPPEPMCGTMCILV
jgi:hypothetical protein